MIFEYALLLPVHADFLCSLLFDLCSKPMPHLTNITLKSIPDDQSERFPFSVPTIRWLAERTLMFESPVTFLIGENGSGKSTLLEAIAVAARTISVGSENLERDATLSHVQRLANQLKLVWRRRTHRGFFLRAEDFFGYAKRMQTIRQEAEAELQAIDDDPKLSTLARNLARMPHARTLAEIKQRYGAGLDTFSHGESFFTLFQSRFVPDGLYLLDEPEAPLSPMRQLAFLAMLKHHVAQDNAQFIIATHSPILMAYPNATIYRCDNGMIQTVTYDEIEHVRLTRDFLADPAQFLRYL